jgi:putative intracellular protease/amidase
MAHAKPDQAELDQDGIAVQKFKSRVLVVVPPREFGEESLRYARSSLHVVHVGTRVVSTSYESEVKGRLQDEFLVDGTLSEARMDDYAGVIFAGGEGSAALADDADALRLAAEASRAGKMIGAWGHATGILARAGVIRGVRVTGDPSVTDAVKRAGGKYTGRQLEKSGAIVTARDDAVGMRFGKALAEIVGI